MEFFFLSLYGNLILQIPLYSPTLFQNETDGEGMNVIMYFKLSERFEKEIPFHFQESIRVRTLYYLPFNSCI